MRHNSANIYFMDFRIVIVLDKESIISDNKEITHTVGLKYRKYTMNLV